MPIKQLHRQLLFDLHALLANQVPSLLSLSTSHFLNHLLRWILLQLWLLLIDSVSYNPLPKRHTKPTCLISWYVSFLHCARESWNLHTSIRAIDSSIPCKYSTSLSGRGCNLHKNEDNYQFHICISCGWRIVHVDRQESILKACKAILACVTSKSLVLGHASSALIVTSIATVAFKFTQHSHVSVCQTVTT